jgi:hypothetical protein
VDWHAGEGGALRKEKALSRHFGPFSRGEQ